MKVWMRGRFASRSASGTSPCSSIATWTTSHIVVENVDRAPTYEGASASTWLSLNRPELSLTWLAQPVRAFLPTQTQNQTEPANPAERPRASTEQRT